jgi:hypothetical protein
MAFVLPDLIFPFLPYLLILEDCVVPSNLDIPCHIDRVKYLLQSVLFAAIWIFHAISTELNIYFKVCCSLQFGYSMPFN